MPSNFPTSEQVVPPPWSLTGSGYILAYKFPREFIDSLNLPTDSALGTYVGGLGVVMVVDYATSDAGGYRELLFIPGQFKTPRGTFYAITKIYVCTMASVVSGRANWGIPKELADFSHTSSNQTEEIGVSQGVNNIAQFRFRPLGFPLPGTTQIIPSSWRTLIQQTDDGRVLLTTPEASGWTQFARLEDLDINPSFFPDIRPFRPLMTLHASKFHMTFPLAKPFSAEVA